MKNRLVRGAAHIKRVYTQPWTVRSGKLNTAVWTVAVGVAVVNFGIGVMVPNSLMWLWLLINTGIMVFDLTMLKWSVTGLLWRKAEAERVAQIERDKEAFYALVMHEYKRP